MSNPDKLVLAGTSLFRQAGRPSRTRQQGVTLIELLIGLTLGLLVVAAALGTLVVSRGAAGTVSDISQLQQQGSYALRVIGVQLRQAGSQDLAVDASSQLYSFNSGFAGFRGLGAAISGSEGATDTLSVSNQASSTLVTTQPFDCLGDAISAGTSIESTFKVSAQQELMCVGTKSSSAQALIGNVAGFRVRYRVNTGSGLQIMKADAVKAADLWGAVKAIEVCLDLRGDETTPDAGSSYLDCNDATTLRGQRVHLVFRNVFNLRTQGL